MHNIAAQFVVARREAWRQNFHLSVDGVLRGVKGERALGPDEPSEESVELGAAAAHDNGLTLLSDDSPIVR